MKQPKKVKCAIYLYFITIALSFVGAIPNYFAADPRPPLFGVVLVWSVIYGTLVGLGYAIALGKNWARHVNAILSLVSLAIIFFAGLSPQLATSVSHLVMVINSIASVIVVVLLYTSSSNQWFKAVQA